MPAKITGYTVYVTVNLIISFINYHLLMTSQMHHVRNHLAQAWYGSLIPMLSVLDFFSKAAKQNLERRAWERGYDMVTLSTVSPL